MKKLKTLFLLGLIFLLSGCTAGGKRLVQEGNRAFAKADYETALQKYLQAQNELPELAEPLYNAANVSYRQQDYEAARQRLESALPLADEELGKDVFFNLGNTYYQTEQYDLALEAYKAVLRLNPDDQDAKYNLELSLQKLEEQEQQQEQQDQQQNDEDSEQQQSQDQQSGDQNDQSQSQNQEQSSDERQDQNDTSGEDQPSNQDQQSGEDQNQSTDEQQTSDNNQTAQDGNQTDNQEENQAQSGTPVQLTAEQARQLLEAAAQDTGSLQEFLQQYYQVPGTLVEEDW